jgi:DHA1 family bicyclomycin/chloramphenicol resistance-like MFS transporter
VIFAVNSAALIAMSLVSGRLVTRFAAPVLLRCGLAVTFLASAGVLAVVLAGGGLGWLLPCFFLLLAGNGLVLPNGTAAAMSGQRTTLGAASALLGVGQFGCGAAVAPLVGVGGGHDALPMAIVIAVAGTAALLVGTVLAPRGRAGGGPVDAADRQIAIS